MAKKQIFIRCALVLVSFIAVTCGGDSGAGGGSTTYTVIYDGNEATGGEVPDDTTNYETGMTVVVKGNTGIPPLERTGFGFSGWNTEADGSGTTYTEGQSFRMEGADVTLYARWTANPTYTVTYDGNGATGGVPVDTTNYETGMAVVVIGNTGALVKTGFAFAGWNTEADGSGTAYSGGKTFVMGSTDVTLYATWAASGSLDTSFDPSAVGKSYIITNGANDTINSIAIQYKGTANEKILIAGNFTNYFNCTGSSISYGNHIARLSTDGTCDYFAGEGTNKTTINSIAVQGDGKILIAGDFDTYLDYFNPATRKGFARLYHSGYLDPSFDPAGTVIDAWECSIAIQGDGKILTGRWKINRLDYDGALDPSFDNSFHFLDSHVHLIAVHSDGKIVLTGGSYVYNGTYRSGIARLNADGSLDPSLDPGLDCFNNNGFIQSLAVQGDGKILIAGDFISYKGTQRKCIARLNTDGSLDTSFVPGAGANSLIKSVVIQSDGKILIGGDFTSYDGTARNHIARLNADGSLDTSFDPGIGANDSVYSIAIQGDGKILIGGDFTSYNGTLRNRIARIWN